MHKQIKCLIFRTNLYDSKWHKILLSLLEKDIQVIIIADQRKETLPYRGLVVVDFDKINCNKLNLHYDEESCWKCGDYAYYLAYNEIEFDYAWMIEPDCYLNGLDVNDLFKIKTDADFVCTYFDRSAVNWYWNDFSVYPNETYKCFFPVTRVSNRAINHLLEKRRFIGASMNDESYVASELVQARFSIAELKDVSDLKYGKKHFSYRNACYLPYLKLLIRLKMVSGNIFHPVYDNFISYVKAFLKKRTWKIILKLENHE